VPCFPYTTGPDSSLGDRAEEGKKVIRNFPECLPNRDERLRFMRSEIPPFERREGWATRLDSMKTAVSTSLEKLRLAASARPATPKSPSPSLQHLRLIQPRHSQPLHRPDQILADLKQYFRIIEMRSSLDDCFRTLFGFGGVGEGG
jgi:hypothetical protein